MKNISTTLGAERTAILRDTAVINIFSTQKQIPACFAASQVQPGRSEARGTHAHAQGTRSIHHLQRALLRVRPRDSQRAPPFNARSETYDPF
jgi:hypothetical protein